MLRDSSRERLADRTVVLVDRLRGGEPAGGAMLDELYREALARFCWGYLNDLDQVEDAMQEIWYRVLASEEVPANFRPWLYKIARNYCLNVIRTRTRRKEDGSLPAASHLADTMTGHLTRLVNDEQKDRLKDALATLSDEQNEALRLRYVEELSRAEIAAVLDISESAVKSRLFESLKRLRDHGSLIEGE